MRDLHRRLARLACGVQLDAAEVERAEFGPATAAAVADFQRSRHLLSSGRCDRQTWSALVEAGYSLGDRLLYLRAPMVRGDDVASLQHALGSRGFHAGRVDGIFGPVTSAALAEFQRNLGLPPDGICGPDTVSALSRLGRRAADTLVGVVREAESHRRRLRELALVRVAVGRSAGLEVVGEASARELTGIGVSAYALDAPDPSAQAQQANRLRVDAFVGFAVHESPGQDSAVVVAYYSTPGYESARGRSLAASVSRCLGDVEVVGIRWPALRETSMPAVVVFLDTYGIAKRVPQLAGAVARAVAAWWTAEEP